MSSQLLYCWLLKLLCTVCYVDCYLQVVPWGFRNLLNWISKEYNNPPVLITENGFSGQGRINDRDRVDFHIVSVSNSIYLS
jgi:beta-glucosidase/6-phospho-beta-glucosidase/beta-galactosidase